MAHRVTHQILQGAVQIPRLSLDPGIIVVGSRQAQPTLHRDLGAQRRQFFDHLIDQCVQVNALKRQRR